MVVETELHLSGRHGSRNFTTIWAKHYGNLAAQRSPLLRSEGAPEKMLGTPREL